VLAILVAAAWIGCSGPRSEEEPSLGSTTQPLDGTVDGQCIGLCNYTNANGYDDYTCAADPCYVNSAGDTVCYMDDCDEMALNAANRNATYNTYRCTLGSVTCNTAPDFTVIGYDCDSDNDGKINWSDTGDISCCCDRVELRPEPYQLGKKVTYVSHSTAGSFKVPGTPPADSDWNSNDFCPRTDIRQRLTYASMGHDVTDYWSNADACNGKPTFQWLRTEATFPGDESQPDILGSGAACGLNLLGLGAAIAGMALSKEVALPLIGTLVAGGWAIKNCTAFIDSFTDSSQTEREVVTWQSVQKNGEPGQFADPPLMSQPGLNNPHPGTPAEPYVGSWERTLAACERRFGGDYYANRAAYMWWIYDGDWARMDRQYRVGFPFWPFSGASFSVEFSEPCQCKSDAFPEGIDCSDGVPDTWISYGDGYLRVTDESDDRQCVGHCPETSDCYTYARSCYNADCSERACNPGEEPSCNLGCYLQNSPRYGGTPDGCPQCQTADDCMYSGGACIAASCNSGVCEYDSEPDGTTCNGGSGDGYCSDGNCGECSADSHCPNWYDDPNCLTWSCDSGSCNCIEYDGSGSGSGAGWCGDGVCGAGEDCSWCSNDCGPCSGPGSGSGSGY
jgi:hypothetical protein